MKVRADFVTNSSSSSYVSLDIKSKLLTDMFADYADALVQRGVIPKELADFSDVKHYPGSLLVIDGDHLRLADSFPDAAKPDFVPECPRYEAYWGPWFEGAGIPQTLLGSAGYFFDEVPRSRYDVMPWLINGIREMSCDLNALRLRVSIPFAPLLNTLRLYTVELTNSIEYVCWAFWEGNWDEFARLSQFDWDGVCGPEECWERALQQVAEARECPVSELTEEVIWEELRNVSSQEMHILIYDQASNQEFYREGYGYNWW